MYSPKVGARFSYPVRHSTHDKELLLILPIFSRSGIGSDNEIYDTYQLSINRDRWDAVESSISDYSEGNSRAHDWIR
jgi:hypothetical protein